MFSIVRFLFFIIILSITENSKAVGEYGVQEAWDNPTANMTAGSIKPGYAQLSWSQGTVLPIKLRHGMVTMITLPEGEEIEDGIVGADGLFDLKANKGARTFHLSPSGSNQGADTNLIITGRSGNKYLFYLRSEPSNSSEITYSQVDIVLEGNGTIQNTSVSNSSYAGMNSIFKKESRSSLGVDGEDYGWIKTMKIDPSEFRFDIDIFVPNPDDYVIAPERVWRDRIFTYIDFGDKVIAMTQRPVVSLLVEGGESPVGFRTDGENGRLLIIEAVGDMVLRSGQRIVCIKRRSKPFLITDTSSVMALAEANVAKSMTSNQSLNNVGYNNFGSGINNTSLNSNMMQTPQNNSIGNYNYQTRSSDTVHMLPTERNTAGSYLPTSGIPLISSNQKGVAIELQSDTSVKALNDYWTGLIAKFSGDDGKGILTPYKNMVFFAVDEQGVGELGSESVASRLYRLRIGPLKDMDTAQSLCDKLLKFSGTICKIVRVQ